MKRWNPRRLLNNLAGTLLFVAFPASLIYFVIEFVKGACNLFSV